MGEPLLEFIADDGAWSLAGLAIGYWLGRVHADIRSTHDEVHEMNKRVSGDEPKQ